MATQQETEALLKAMQEIADFTKDKLITGGFCKQLGLEGRELHSKHTSFVQKLQGQQLGKGQSPDFH